MSTFLDLDRGSITRAREMMSNLVMNEVQHEDPKAQESFEAAVRHQIVMNCQNLRISLVLLDGLMHMYNDAVSAGKITPGFF